MALRRKELKLVYFLSLHLPGIQHASLSVKNWPTKQNVLYRLRQQDVESCYKGKKFTFRKPPYNRFYRIYLWIISLILYLMKENISFGLYSTSMWIDLKNGLDPSKCTLKVSRICIFGRVEHGSCAVVVFPLLSHLVFLHFNFVPLVYLHFQ